MLTMTTLRKKLGAAALTVAFAVSLGACSSEDSTTEEFCSDGKDIEQRFEDFEPATSEEAVSTLKELESDLNDITPPKEIEDDWNVLTGFVSDFLGEIDGIDPDDQEAFQTAVTDFYSNVDSDKLTEASENLDDFTTENCES